MALMKSNYYRKTSPQMALMLWEVIEEIGYFSDLSLKSFGDQMFTKFKIRQNEYNLKKLIDNAIEDLIIVEEKDNSNRLRYKPNPSLDQLKNCTNDWYCNECHSCNEEELVIGCNSCFRSFHKNCINQSLLCFPFQCIYCRNIENIENYEDLRLNTIEKSSLNRLLGFVIENVEKSFSKRNVFELFAMKGSDEKLSLLVFKSLDLKSIDLKVRTDGYNYVQEFENDLNLFIHNYFVSHLQEFDPNYKCLNQLIARFTHEVSELKNCVDCYNYSNNNDFDDPQNPNDWFALVCDPPHEVLYAKHTNYPFWPSKVISISDDGQTYDVRFFDSPKTRALVPIERLRPIEYKSKNSSVKKSLILVNKYLANMRSKGIAFIRTIADDDLCSSDDELKDIKVNFEKRPKRDSKSGRLSKRLLTDKNNYSR